MARAAAAASDRAFRLARMLKVIGAGFGRTGTSSTATALELLGFAPCHHMRELFNRP